MKKAIKYTGVGPLTYMYNISDKCIFDIHLHDTYEIFQALSDNIRYFVEGTSYSLNPGDIIITNNNEIHRPTTLDTNPYERRYVQFDPSLFPTHLEIDYNPLEIFENRKPGTFNHLIIPKPARSVIDDFFKAIDAAFYLNTPKSMYEGRLLLNQLLIELDTLYTNINTSLNRNTHMDSRIIEILNYLDIHFKDPFNLDKFSNFHHMDKYHLSHIFKENTGFTLMEYIQSKRIQHAKTLLQKNLTINEISLQCGFNDYSNFFKTFKRLVKKSPLEYKNEIIKH